MKKSANATSGPKPLTRSRAGSRLSVWLLLAFIAPAALAAVQEDFSSDPVASGRFSQLTAGTESTFVYDPVAGLLRATVDVDTSPAYYLSNPFTACTDAAD